MTKLFNILNAVGVKCKIDLSTFVMNKGSIFKLRVGLSPLQKFSAGWLHSLEHFANSSGFMGKQNSMPVVASH